MSWILARIGAKRAELEGRVDLLRKELTDARDAPDQDSDARNATPIGMVTVPVRGAGRCQRTRRCYGS